MRTTGEYIKGLLSELGSSDVEMPRPEAQYPARIVRERAPRPAPKKEIVPEPASRQSRLRLRRRGEDPQPEQRQTSGANPLHSRLSVALWAARDLEVLLGEMPVLAEPRAVAHAFLSEVVELFGPQTAAVYAQRPEGWFSVIAPHGLSQVEAEIKVSPHQPLFHELITTGSGVYVAPVDLAQGFVAGIGGARTETLMAAPLEVGGTCSAIVVVGGSRLVEGHLTRLVELAADAAPGLSFALLIDRLRSRM